jgi:hypothetical protein
VGVWTFVFAISALSIVAGIVNNWIKARHGYPMADDGSGSDIRHTRQLDAVCAENRELKERLAKVSGRLETLERIVTDQPNRLAREIDALGEPTKGSV